MRLLGAASATLVAATVVAQQNPPAKQSVWDGVYIDVVAYLLQAIKFPSGARNLPRAPEQLESMAIERSK